MEAPKFYSAKLVYRAVDEEIDKKLFTEMFSDPLTALLSGGGVAAPFSAANLKSQLDWCTKCLLAVTICLPKSAEEPTVAGEAIGILQIAPGAAKSADRCTDIGIVLHPSYQGKGYGPEALEWLLHACFTRYGLHRVELGTWGFNTNAHKVYEKVGFVKEGVKRGNRFVEGKFTDTYEYSMLVDEWHAIQAKKAAQA